jgi:Glucosamine 6-phosphate synthetase, contains amidotransferase and phosphosugar isomerase domains
MNEEFSNPMREQVFSLPELMKSQWADLEPKARTVLSTPEIFNVQRIVLTGCGDSYAACMGMKYMFESLTGIRTELVTAVDLARFYPAKFLGGSPNNPLVIAVSNSGKIARVAEALERVRSHGAFVLGVTGNLESPLAVNSDRVLKLDIPKFVSAPGTRSYMVSVMALLLVAIRIGEVRGRYTMDQAKAYRKDILAQADALEMMLPEMDEKMLEMAKKWNGLHHFDFVGAGFDYATAWFGMAKVYEAIGDFASHINIEEWLHLNFFMRDIKGIGTVVVANTANPALSRCREMIDYAAELGRPLLVISDGGKEDFGADCDYVKVPKTAFAQTMMLTQFVPLCLLFGYLQKMRGEKSGRGCEGPWSFSKGAACVRNSEKVIL